MPDFPSQPLSSEAQEALERAIDEGSGSDGGGPESEGPSRAFRLKRKESGPDGVRRIAVGRLDSALEHLRDGLEQDFAVAIHEARKDLKKSRALLRLVRARLGDGVYRAENDRLRDAGRMLSAARDAEVKLETVRALRDRFPEEMPEAPYEALVTALDAEREEMTARGAGLAEAWRSADQAAAMIEASRAGVEAWPLDGPAWKLVKKGLATSYRRSRKRFRDTVSEPTPEAVHEWRKRVKDLWYHQRLIRGSWPEMIDGLADQTHELSDLLGDHHDLTVLAEDARSRAAELGDGDAQEALMELIERRQDELLDAAIPIGERLFAEDPKPYVRRIRSYWRAWRAD
jgi:CHAD domain-containing protein